MINDKFEAVNEGTVFVPLIIGVTLIVGLEFVHVYVALGLFPVKFISGTTSLWQYSKLFTLTLAIGCAVILNEESCPIHPFNSGVTVNIDT